MVDSIISKIKTLSIIISVSSLLVMVFIVVVEIISRTLFSHSFMIADEYSSYLLSMIVFLGLINAFDSGSFVKVEIVYSKYSDNIKKYVDSFFLILLLLYSLVLTIYIIMLNYDSFRMNLKSISLLETPLYIPQFFMSFGIVLFDIYLILKLIKQKGRG